MVLSAIWVIPHYTFIRDKNGMVKYGASETL